MKVTIRTILPMLTLLCLSGCTDPVEDLYGGEEGVQIVALASKANAFRIESPSGSHNRVTGYKMQAGPVAVPSKQLGQLRSILLDDSTYEWDSIKACIPDYGVRIEFVHKSGRIDVLLCFECDILAVYRDGRFVGQEDFDDARPELVAIVKGLFPSDKAIQSLKPRGR